MYKKINIKINGLKINKFYKILNLKIINMLILTLLVIPTLGQLELGSLNGYYTLKEIGEAIMNITNSYPGIASKTAGSYFQELSITNKSAYF